MKNKSSIYSRYFTYIKPVTKIKIVRTYGSTIFTLLTLAVFIVFAVKPTVETIIVLQKKLDDSNQILEKLNKKESGLDLARQNYEKLDSEIKSKILLAIPDTSKLKSITQSFETIAKNHEASISALQIQPLVLGTKKENSISTISEITFTFNTTGKYKDLIDVLQDLKNGDRLISIDNLSLSQVSEGAGLIMSISGKAYYLK